MISATTRSNALTTFAAGLLAAGGLALQVPVAVRAAETPDKSRYTLFNPTPVAEMRELSTDRPDQTESPNTVDAGHFQVELDFVNLTLDREDGFRTRDLAVAPMNLKVGLTNCVDLQLMIDPVVRSRLEDQSYGTVAKASGFGDVTTRVKINFWGNDGGPTAFAFMPFVKWPLSANEVRNGETEGGLIFILGYELPGGWGSAVMTEFDFVDDGSGGRDTEWLNSITFSHDLTEKIGAYFEFVAVTSNAAGYRWQGQFDTGLTFALSDNRQLDLGCNFGVTKSAPDFQPFVGFSFRY